MVSNSLSRRRHVIASPAICKPPWPPPPPPPVGVTCVCGLAPTWYPTTRTVNGGMSANNSANPAGSPVKGWVSSEPQLDWNNPYQFGNGMPVTLGNHTLPPGYTSIKITVGFVFQNGLKCSEHTILATP